MFYFVHFLTGLKKPLAVLKNSWQGLCRRKAQSMVEYFMIFAAVAVIALLSVAAFYDNAHKTAEEFFNKSANAIMGNAVESTDIH